MNDDAVVHPLGNRQDDFIERVIAGANQKSLGVDC